MNTTFSIHTFIDYRLHSMYYVSHCILEQKSIYSSNYFNNEFADRESISIGLKCMIKNTKARLKFEHTFMLVYMCVCVFICGKVGY